MSIHENLTQMLARRLSRRNFLKGLGTAVLGLGAALMGKPVEVQAGPGCCQSPECSGCLQEGSNCPSNRNCLDVTTCCLRNCAWSCSICQLKYMPYDVCYCSHNDMEDCGGTCGSSPEPA